MPIFSKLALRRAGDQLIRRIPARHLSAARPAIAQLRDVLRQQISDMKDAGTFKSERIITSDQSTQITVEGTHKRILNFCANNYLGLANNPEVVKYSKEMLDKFGAGLSSVRFICGTQTIHKELEKKLAKFHGREDTILYASCFDANAGIFEAVLTPQDAVFSDELNHASIIDGIRLCKAQKQRYKHRDMADLENMLKASDARLKLIVTDGVFSMDGNIAPLPQIVDLAAKYNALVLMDECHATGFFGATGRGTEDYYNVMGRVDIINSTLGKALGGAAGGYTTGPKELITLLRQKSRPYLFSNSLPPAVVGSGIKVMDMLMESDQLSQKVQSNTKRFRDAMVKAGFVVGGENHPICPVMLGDARLASIFADQMLSRGIYVIGFSYPVVPKGKARIRVQISAAHTTDDIDHAVAAFIEVGKSLKVIKCSALLLCAFPLGVVRGNAIEDRNLFATELFQTIATEKQNENVIISPVAIQTALGLAYYGAEGKTAIELQKGLHATPHQSKNGIAKSYHKLLHSYIKPKTTLEIANKIYVKDSLKIVEGFRDVAQKYFDSDAEELDFNNEKEAVEKINKWLAEKTNGKIERLLDNVEPDINMALVNAIYFKAKWARPFMDDETSDREFWLNDKESVKVSTMFADNWYNYADYPELDAKAIELFFENTDLRMWFILPNERNGLLALEQKLKGVDFNALEERWQLNSVTVKLPKFKFEFDTDLKPYLMKLGIETMFTDAADFSGIFKESAISTRVSRVQHKAFIDVNEIGCEAAAASVAVGVPMSLPLDPKTFIADHPFVFIIRDKHAVYFTGHIAKF